MKLPEWFARLTPQARWMVIFIVLLLALIATRWGYISHTAGEAVKARFTPSSEQISESAEQTAAPSALTSEEAQ